MAALLALLAAVGWGSSDYAAGSASRRSSATSVVVLTHFAAVIALLYLATDFGPVWVTLGDVRDVLRSPDADGGVRWAAPGTSGDPTGGDIAWGLAAGLGGGLGAMLLFRGLGKGSMAVVAPITATGAAAIPALYGIANGEQVTILGLLGIVLALVAIVLVSLNGETLDWTAGPGADTDEPTGERSDVVDATSTLLVTSWATWSGDHPAEARRAAEWLDSQLGTTLVSPAARQVVATGAPVVTLDDRPIGSGGSGEIRMSLRRIRSTVVALTIGALLAAAVAAVGPVLALVAGRSHGPTELASLALAAAVAVLTLAVNGAARMLFRAQPRPAVERRADPPSFDERAVRVERRTDSSTFAVRSIVRQPGVPEALLSGVGFGLFFICISRAADAAGYWPLVSARAISVVVFVLVACFTSTALLPERGSRRFVVLAGLLDAAAAVFFVLSARAGLLSVGAVLASLYPGATVLLARFVGGERIRRQQLIGLALAACAVSMLAI